MTRMKVLEMEFVCYGECKKVWPAEAVAWEEDEYTFDGVMVPICPECDEECIEEVRR